MRYEPIILVLKKSMDLAGIDYLLKEFITVYHVQGVRLGRQNGCILLAGNHNI